MNTEELKKKYESGDYVLYWHKNHNKQWAKINPIEVDWTYKYKLIHKSHSHIADAAITNPDVVIYVLDGFIYGKAFFSAYNEHLDYRLKLQEEIIQSEKERMKYILSDLDKQDFNGGYVVASEEAYNVLVKYEYEYKKEWTIIDYNYYFIEEGRFWGIKAINVTTCKQFYIVDGKPSWDEPQEGFERVLYHGDKDRTRTNFTKGETTQQGSDESYIAMAFEPKEKEECVENKETYPQSENIGKKEDILHITSEDGTEYRFEKPEFECELLKVIDNKIIGYIINRVDEVYPKQWSLKGINGQNFYNLTPIKPKWYEDESNFPCLVIKDYGNNDLEHRLAYCLWEYNEYIEDGFKLATKEKALSLVVEE